MTLRSIWAAVQSLSWQWFSTAPPEAASPEPAAREGSGSDFCAYLKGAWVRPFSEGIALVPGYHPQAGATCRNLACQTGLLLSPTPSSAPSLLEPQWFPWEPNALTLTLGRTFTGPFSQLLMSCKNSFCNVWKQVSRFCLIILPNRRLTFLQWAQPALDSFDFQHVF